MTDAAGQVPRSAHAERSRAAGVDFQTGRVFTFDGRARAHARLGFACLAPEELRRAVAKLRGAL